MLNSPAEIMENVQKEVSSGCASGDTLLGTLLKPMKEEKWTE